MTNMFKRHRGRRCQLITSYCTVLQVLAKMRNDEQQRTETLDRGASLSSPRRQSPMRRPRASQVLSTSSRLVGRVYVVARQAACQKTAPVALVLRQFSNGDAAGSQWQGRDAFQPLRVATGTQGPVRFVHFFQLPSVTQPGNVRTSSNVGIVDS
jgi:hypothetical protein